MRDLALLECHLSVQPLRTVAFSRLDHRQEEVYLTRLLVLDRFSNSKRPDYGLLMACLWLPNGHFTPDELELQNFPNSRSMRG